MNAASHIINARDLRRGLKIVDHRMDQPLTVTGVQTCADGTIRVFTNKDEQRMTGSIRVRVLN